jgi:amino acid permease
MKSHYIKCQNLKMIYFDFLADCFVGTVWTATTHAITAVIGSGVLALPWSVAQMGWIIGPLALIGCAYITYFTAVLLTDCYRTPDPVHGKRNHTYMDVVRSILGNF